MSATVDSRVVEMHFDNSDFMDKISETIAALEKLNDQVSSLNSSQFGSNLTSGIDDTSLANFNNELGNIESRFSVLDVVGMSIINRLTNAALTSIHNVYNAITRDFSSGGMTRALNLEQAKFLLEGLEAPVEKIMDNVDEAVTGTAYGLDEAAKAASSFYASGVEAGPKMESALKAVAGVAAMTGSDFASIADIFTTTAGQGKVMTMQLRMLEGRGLNAAAILAKSLGKTEEEIRDMVTKGKIDFETFSKAMDEAFGEHAKDANKTFNGALANMQTALKRMGAKFYVPGLEYARDIFNEFRNSINNFSNALDTTAVVSFTKFGSSLRDYIVKTLEDANGKFKVFENLGSGFGNIFSAFLNVMKAVGTAFNNAFPKSALGFLTSFSNKFKTIGISVYAASTHLEGFTNILTAFFNFVSSIGNIAKGILSIFTGITSSASSAAGPLTKITELIRKFFEALNKRTASLTIFETISKTLTGAGNIISQAFDMATHAIGKLIKTISGGIANINSFEEASTAMGLAITAIFAENKIRILRARYNRLFGKQGLFRGGALNTINNFLRAFDIPAEIADTLTGVQKSLKAMTREVYAKSLLEIAAGVLALAIALKIMEGLDKGRLLDSMSAVTILMGEMTAVLVILMKTLSAADFTDSLKGIYALGSVTNALMKIGVAMILMAKALQMIGELKPAELARGMAGLTIMLGEMLGFAILINKYGGKISGETGLAILAIAESLKIMSEAVSAFSSLEPNELAKGLGSVTILMGAIFGMIVGISKMGGAGGAGMAAAGAGMVLIAGSIRILAPAVSELGKLDLATIGKGLIAIAGGLSVMAAASRFASLEGGAAIFIMALGLSSLSVSIQRLGSMDIKELAKGLGAIAVALGIFTAAGMLLGPVVPVLMEVALGMLVMSGAIAVLGAGLVLIGAGLTAISAGILSFSSVTQTALYMFMNVFKVMVIELTKLLPTIMVSLAEGFVEFIEAIAELAPRLRAAFTTIVTEAIGAFEDNIPRLVSTGINFIVNLISGIEEAVPKVMGSAVNIIASFIEGLAEGMAQIVSAGMDLMLSFINGLAEGVRAHKNDIRNAIINLCTAILEAFCSFFGIASPSTVMEAQGVNLILGLVNGIKKTAGKAKTALVNAVKSAYSAIKKYVKNFLSAGVSIVTSIVRGIKSKISQIGSSIKSGLTTAVSSVKNTVSSFTSAGRSIVTGIASGIRNGLSSVISAVGSIASRALSHFKSKLGINSPSKEFAKLGAGIPEGTVKGVKKTAKYVYAAIDHMGENTISRMRNVISDLSDTLSLDSDFNPTITPVLDLSNLEKESNRIDSLLTPSAIEASYSTALAANANQNSAFIFAMNELVKAVNDSASNNDKQTIFNVTNNVDGSENPEEFANRLVGQLRTHMRMV